MCMLKNFTLSFPKTRNFHISKLLSSLIFAPTLQQLNFWTFVLDYCSWEHSPWHSSSFCKNRFSSISDPGSKMFFLINFFFPLCIHVSTVCCLRKFILKLIRLHLMLIFVLHMDIEPPSCSVCFCPTGFSIFWFQSLKDIIDLYPLLYRQLATVLHQSGHRSHLADDLFHIRTSLHSFCTLKGLQKILLEELCSI